MKATASKSPLNGINIDRPTRASTSSAPKSPSLRGSKSPRRSWTRSRSRSRSRSHSSYRDSRGYKRRRGDDYDDYESRHSRYEPSRRFGSRYDDRYHDRGVPPRRLKSYHDLDREEGYGGDLQYSDDYDRRRDKRPRPRSRSPYREVRKPKRYDDTDSVDSKRRGSSSDRVVSERGKNGPDSRDSERGAETRETQMPQNVPKHAHVTDEYVNRSCYLRQRTRD